MNTYSYTIFKSEPLQRVCLFDNMFNVVIAVDDIGIVAEATILSQWLCVTTNAHPFIHL